MLPDVQWTARLPRLRQIFDTIEKWTETKDKFEAMDILNKYDIPCGPILSMKELAEDQSLRATGTVVEVDHPTRGKYLSVGNPIKLYGLNSVGLQRRGFKEDVIAEIKKAYRLFFNSDKNVSQAMDQARAELQPYVEIEQMIAFVEASGRGVTT